MDDVGADDEVERLGFEALLGSRLFEIEDFALDLGERRELLHRPWEEARGDVGKGIGMEPALQQRQHVGREAGGAATDFEDAQSAAFGKLPRRFLQRCGEAGEPLARIKAVAVKLIEQLRTRASEENLDRVLFAAQDRAKFGANARAKQRLREMTGTFRDEGPHGSLSRVRCRNELRRGAPALCIFLQQSMSHETDHEPPEGGLHRRGDVERFCGKRGVSGDTHFAKPTGQLRDGEIVACDHGRLQILAAAIVDHLLHSPQCGLLELRERNGSERRARAAGGRSLPIDMIDYVPCATLGAGAPDTSDTDRAETIDQHAGLASLIVESNAPLDEFFVTLDDPGAHASRCAQRVKEKDARKTHRQFHAGTAILHRGGARGESLERTVEEDRVHGVLRGARSDRFR